MTGILILDILIWGLIIIASLGLLYIVVMFLFTVGTFFLATGLFIIPAKQVKIDLKAIAETEIQQRIYLDEYTYTLAQADHQKKIDEKAKTIKEQDSKIRKKAAHIKSLDAQIEQLENDVKKAPKNKPKKDK